MGVFEMIRILKIFKTSSPEGNDCYYFFVADGEIRKFYKGFQPVGIIEEIICAKIDNPLILRVISDRTGELDSIVTKDLVTGILPPDSTC